jgi:phosphoribosylanthranilate isomerase
MSLVIKICGITTPDALDTAIEAGADMVGFVFFAPSPRNLDLQDACSLGARVRGIVQKVALTVDAGDDELAAIVEALRPDVLQLHGKESPHRLAEIGGRFGLPIMKALPIEKPDDLAALGAYSKVAAWILFDAHAPRGATRPGGLGKRFDWTILHGVDPGLPFMLSGGLDAENVGEALRITRAPAVDVSSGVERAPGVKDVGKIRAFIRAARAAERKLTAPRRTARHA